MERRSGAVRAGATTVKNRRRTPKGHGRWYLVCYDVRDPKRLRKVARLLEGHGERIQYSVFRCWLSPSGIEKLRWELTDTCVTEEDDVLFIPLCARCVRGISVTQSALKDADWEAERARFKIL